MKPDELFIEVVRGCQDLPADIRSQAANASGIKESCFDKSYIQFLDEQIHLSPHGPEWTEILRRRREGLRSFCSVPLLSGRIRVGLFDTWIKVDPKTKAVVFWEKFEHEPAAWTAPSLALTILTVESLKMNVECHSLLTGAGTLCCLSA